MPIDHIRSASTPEEQGNMLVIINQRQLSMTMATGGSAISVAVWYLLVIYLRSSSHTLFLVKGFQGTGCYSWHNVFCLASTQYWNPLYVRGHSSKLSFPNNHTPSHIPSHTPSVTCSNTPYIPPHHRQLHPCWTIISPSPSVTLRHYLRHGLRHVLYYPIVLLLSLFFYLYNLTLILAEVLSYSFRTSC